MHRLLYVDVTDIQSIMKIGYDTHGKWYLLGHICLTVFSPVTYSWSLLKNSESKSASSSNNISHREEFCTSKDVGGFSPEATASSAVKNPKNVTKLENSCTPLYIQSEV